MYIKNNTTTSIPFRQWVRARSRLFELPDAVKVEDGAFWSFHSREESSLLGSTNVGKVYGISRIAKPNLKLRIWMD